MAGEPSALEIQNREEMSIKKNVYFVLAVLLLCSNLAFAGGRKEAPEEETVTIQFVSWMVAEESGGEEWLPERIGVWAQDHPGVQVEVTPLGWEDTSDKITLQIRRGNAPDIFTIESLWLGKFGKMPGGVVDLYEFMDDAFISTLVPACRGGEIDGKMAALVWNPNPWVLVYNRNLVRRAGVSGNPKDFSDFLNQVEAVSSLGPEIFGFGMMLGVDEYAADTFHIILWQTGGDLLDAGGRPVVTSPGTMRAIGLVKDCVDGGMIPFGEEVRNMRTMFARGMVGFFFEGPWIAGVFDGEGMSRDEWDVAPWPGDVQPASYMLCMSQQSEHKELAWDLMKFIVTDEVTTKEYFKRTGLMPVVAAQYRDTVYDNHYSKTFLDQMSRLRNPNVWGSQKKFEIEVAFMEEIQKILLGRGEVPEVLTRLEYELEYIIAE
jgi:multiple sugar transport system substrate-binding protein